MIVTREFNSHKRAEGKQAKGKIFHLQLRTLDQRK